MVCFGVNVATPEVDKDIKSKQEVNERVDLAYHCQILVWLRKSKQEGDFNGVPDTQYDDENIPLDLKWRRWLEQELLP